MFGAVMRISFFFGKPGMGFLLRAVDRVRTDLPLTRRLLYQLSYDGETASA